MVYVVKFKNGEVRTIEKVDLDSIDVDRVEVVYPGTLEIEVAMELVPQGEEQERFAATVASFREKYRGKVVSEKGLVDFEDWFSTAPTGARAIVPERALVPVKTYRVVKIKGNKKITPPSQSPLPPEVAVLSSATPLPEKKSPSKPEQRTSSKQRQQEPISQEEMDLHTDIKKSLKPRSQPDRSLPTRRGRPPTKQSKQKEKKFGKKK